MVCPCVSSLRVRMKRVIGAGSDADAAESLPTERGFFHSEATSGVWNCEHHANIQILEELSDVSLTYEFRHICVDTTRL